jgi:hypothetical protein
MQKAYVNGFSPATIAKTILDEFKCFNPLNLLKHSFCYCSPVFLLFWSDATQCKENSDWGQASSRAFKKLKRGRCGEWST